MGGWLFIISYFGQWFLTSVTDPERWECDSTEKWVKDHGDFTWQSASRNYTYTLYYGLSSDISAEFYHVLVVYVSMAPRPPGVRGRIPAGLMKSTSIDFWESSFQTHDVAFCCLPEQTSKCDDRGHAGAVEEQDGGETLQTEGVSDVAPVER